MHKYMKVHVAQAQSHKSLSLGKKAPVTEVQVPGPGSPEPEPAQSQHFLFFTGARGRLARPRRSPRVESLLSVAGRVSAKSPTRGFPLQPGYGASPVTMVGRHPATSVPTAQTPLT